MDDRRFDNSTRQLAHAKNRRAIVKGLLGIGAAALSSDPLVHRTDAARRGYSGPPTPYAPPLPTQPPPAPTAGPTEVVGCASGSSACGNACCPDSNSMCCDNACCYGACYGEELCCESPRVFCGLSSTCCDLGAKCCDNGGACYDTSKGQCCYDSDCKTGEKCCPEFGCVAGPNACCHDSDCPRGDVCTENNTCCHATCTAGTCGSDGCGGICPCPDSYSCLGNGTCARQCQAGSVFCEEHACGSCFVEAAGNTGYCADETHGIACEITGNCPAGQFCTLLDPPSHCVTACGA